MHRLTRHLWLCALVLGASAVTLLATYYAPRDMPGPMLAVLPVLVVAAAVVVDFTWLVFHD